MLWLAHHNVAQTNLTELIRLVRFVLHLHSTVQSASATSIARPRPPAERWLFRLLSLILNLVRSFVRIQQHEHDDHTKCSIVSTVSLRATCVWFFFWRQSHCRHHHWRHRPFSSSRNFVYKNHSADITSRVLCSGVTAKALHESKVLGRHPRRFRSIKAPLCSDAHLPQPLQVQLATPRNQLVAANEDTFWTLALDCWHPVHTACLTRSQTFAQPFTVQHLCHLRNPFDVSFLSAHSSHTVSEYSVRLSWSALVFFAFHLHKTFTFALPSSPFRF